MKFTISHFAFRISQFLSPVLSVFFMGALLAGLLSPKQIEAAFFQQHSTWYEKIPATPQVMANSSNYVSDIVINRNGIGINYKEWSVPVWYAAENTPNVTVAAGTMYGAPYNLNAWLLGWNIVPIPPEALPAGNASNLAGQKRDGHMVVVSYDRRYAWDFFGAMKDATGRWSARVIRRWDLNRDGINSPYDLLGSVRAAPVPLLHGLIMHDEIQRGYVDHALAFAYWGAKKPDRGVYPAVKRNNGVSDRPWAMSTGFRLQLDPSLNIDSLSLNRAGKIIAKALQEYGMIFVENCGKGCNSVYAESLDDKPVSWTGILGGLPGVPLNRFRVVTPIYPSAVKPSAPSSLQLFPQP